MVYERCEHAVWSMDPHMDPHMDPYVGWVCTWEGVRNHGAGKVVDGGARRVG